MLNAGGYVPVPWVPDYRRWFALIEYSMQWKREYIARAGDFTLRPAGTPPRVGSGAL